MTTTTTTNARTTFDALFNAVVSKNPTNEEDEGRLNWDQFLAFLTVYARPRLVLRLLKKHHRPRSSLSPQWLHQGLCLFVKPTQIHQRLLVSNTASNTTMSTSTTEEAPLCPSDGCHGTGPDRIYPNTTVPSPRLLQQRSGPEDEEEQTILFGMSGSSEALREADRRWTEFRASPFGSMV